MTIEKDAADYLALFELTWQDDKALVLLTELLAAYRREKEKVNDLQEVIGSHRRLVRELDVTLNGEECAAKQASLCDMVAQIKKEFPLLRREKERADKLHTAIILTLDENGHLSDGDNCTLKALKDAVGMG